MSRFAACLAARPLVRLTGPCAAGHAGAACSSCACSSHGSSAFCSRAAACSRAGRCAPAVQPLLVLLADLCDHQVIPAVQRRRPVVSGPHMSPELSAACLWLCLPQGSILSPEPACQGAPCARTAVTRPHAQPRLPGRAVRGAPALRAPCAPSCWDLRRATCWAWTPARQIAPAGCVVLPSCSTAAGHGPASS